MLSPEIGTLTQVAIAFAAIAIAITCALLALHAFARFRRRSREAAVSRVALEFAAFLTGRTNAQSLRAALSPLPDVVLWDALEQFADNITGAEWSQLSEALRDLPEVTAERRRLSHGRAWRRALAARRIGMIDGREHRAELRAAMVRGPVIVRLSAILALARARDVTSVKWLMRHPDALDPLGLHLGVAILKRYGSRIRGVLRRALAMSPIEGTLEVSAIEVLGLWKDRASRPLFERALEQGGLEARVTSARALGRIGSPRSVAPLCAALDDPGWQVRAQAARALGAIPASRSVRHLARSMTDMSWWVRRNAAYALAAHGEEGRNALYRVAELGVDPYAREMAIEVMQAEEWERRSPGGINRAG